MKCRYCQLFCEAKWRVTSGDEDNPKKKIVERYCPHLSKYIRGEQEEIKCPSFEAFHIFWCERNDCFMHVEGCLNKSAKELDPDCFGCSQRYEISEVQKARRFQQRKLEIEANKPKLIKRVKTEE